MERLLARTDLLRCDVVKVSHHGSARMLPEFYAAASARTAVIPVGRNAFGHPRAETLVALRNAGSSVLRTDLNGEITVVLDGHGGIAVRTQLRAEAA
jgi:competence protein ComEC